MITAKAHRIYNDLEAFATSNKCQQLSDIPTPGKSDTAKHTESIVDFIRNELSKKTFSPGTFKNHRSLITKLNDFGRIQIFDDLTHANISDFDAFLRKTIKSQPVLYKRHKTLQSYIKDAIARGICKNDQYTSFSIRKGRSKDPAFLLEAEVQKLQKCELDTESLCHVRDLFLFQCFSGLAYVDLMEFDASSIYEVDGYSVYRSSREKTDESFISVLLPETRAILDRYEGILPKISNQKYNLYLKVVAATAGLKKRITTHTGRHTFATYLINRGIPLETVSRALGHATLRQSMHYAKLLGRKVISDMSALAGLEDGKG